MRTRGLSEAPVVVMGSPRSGTSWVMRSIARQSRYCAIFEPLHPRWWPGARAAGFGDRPSDGDARKREYLRQVFRGEKARTYIRRPRWSEPVGANPELLIRGAVKRLLANRLVVKFVRACRLLPWLVEEFPECRYVYVVRDPYAVVNSQLSRGVSSYVDDRTTPFDFLNSAAQSDSVVGLLCDRIRSDAAQVLDEACVREIDSLEGCLALSWYADNFVAQRVAARDEAVLAVRYQDLLTNPDAELDKIHVHVEVGAPSSTALEVKDPDRQLHKWQEQLSDYQIKSIQETIHALENAYESLRW